MFAIRSYFVVIMSVMGTIFAFRPIDFAEKQSFFASILSEHNSYRRIHGSQDMIFSPYMSLLWNKYLNASNYNSENPQNVGVNKFTMSLSHDSILNAELAKKLVASWYEKGVNYNYLVEPNNKNADEFTQVLWNETKELGLMMGVENNILYVIATYHPKGNIKTKYLANVKEPQNVVNIRTE